MKLAFVGTCQVFGMVRAAQVLRPDDEIVGLHIGAPHAPEEIRQRIADCDFVVSQVPDAPDGKGGPDASLSPAALADVVDKAIFMPAAVFGGFHPDMRYVHLGSEMLSGYRDAYHSNIILGAFLNGLNEAHTTRLFNMHVFAELGYLSAYPAAIVALIDFFAKHGYDLTSHLDRLLQERQIFMHTVNHPAIPLLSQLAVAALSRLGLVHPDTPAPHGMVDDLADGFTAPVFPPIAKRLGLIGSTTYLQSLTASQGGPRQIPLEDYVAGSFDVYRSCAPIWFETDTAAQARNNLRRLLA